MNPPIFWMKYIFMLNNVNLSNTYIFYLLNNIY
jgi:hypothetical protein